MICWISRIYRCWWPWAWSSELVISFCIYILPGCEYRMFFFYIDYWISALIFVKQFLKIALIFKIFALKKKHIFHKILLESRYSTNLDLHSLGSHFEVQLKKIYDLDINISLNRKHKYSNTNHCKCTVTNARDEVECRRHRHIYNVT